MSGSVQSPESLGTVHNAIQGVDRHVGDAACSILNDLCGVSKMIGTSTNQLMQHAGQNAQHISGQVSSATDHILSQSSVNQNSNARGFSDVLLNGARNTSDILQNNCNNTSALSGQASTYAMNHSNQACRDTSDILRYVGDGFKSTMSDSNRNTSDILRNTGDGFRGIMKQNCDDTSYIVSGLNDSTRYIDSQNANRHHNMRDAADRQFHRTNDNIYSGNHYLRAELGRDHESIRGELGREHHLIFNKLDRHDASMGDFRREIAVDVCKTKGAVKYQVAEKTAAVQKDVLELRGSLNNQIGDLKLLYAEKSCGIEKEIMHTKAALERQASDYFAKTQLDIEKTKCALEKQACENTSTIRIEALQTAKEQMKQLSDCCCKLENLVITTAKETQNLIDAKADDVLKEKIADLRAHNIALQCSRNHCNNNGHGNGNGHGN
ncbi:MAG TPA: hypothetical protein V6C58_02425 [Allocoleopsis sp.]